MGKLICKTSCNLCSPISNCNIYTEKKYKNKKNHSYCTYKMIVVDKENNKEMVFYKDIHGFFVMDTEKFFNEFEKVN